MLLFSVSSPAVCCCSNGVEIPQEIRPIGDHDDEHAYSSPLLTAKPACLDYTSFRYADVSSI